MNSCESYLSVLNPEQREAVEHEGSPLLILAGAGSGKTRVITTKIAYLIGQKGIPAFNILAVTFTKKAAREMQERARLLEPLAENAQIRTFHSFGSWFLRRYAENAGLGDNFTVYDEEDMLTLVLKAYPELNRKEAGEAVHFISLAKDFCYTPESEELGTIFSKREVQNGIVLKKFPEIYEAYEKRLRSTGNVDFGDLIMLPVMVLQENEGIRAQMQRRFRVIMVDEYQDSNVAQFKLLQCLSGISEGSGTYVCVVGDDDQSIYSFRGAEVQNILNFQEQFPGTKLIRLERNYRSTDQILHAADAVVSKNVSRLGKTLKAERGSGSKPVLIFCPSQDDETQVCADLIQEAFKKGCPYKDWAILYRTNAQSLGFETEFLRRQIPYTVVGSLKFYQREEIKDMLAVLALTANPCDEIAFRRIVNKPVRGIGEKTQDAVINAARLDYDGDDTFMTDRTEASLVHAARNFAGQSKKKACRSLAEFADMMDDFAEFVGMNEKDEENSDEVSENAILALQAAESEKSADAVSTAEKKDRLSVFVEYVAEKTGLMQLHKEQDEISGTQKVLNIQELINSSLLYPCSRKGLLDFLDAVELDRSLEEKNAEDTDSVTLITLHNTKGLEFPRVIITGLEMGIFPRENKTDSDLEEERRLFYVGITRAKNQLYITSCGVRRLYGQVKFMQPSLFLMEAGDCFTVIGKKPAAYEEAIADSSGENFTAADRTYSLKWKKGVRVFHDDYGYGQIIDGRSADGEYVITVMFENGGKKKFIPKYQENSLMVVKD